MARMRFLNRVVAQESGSSLIKSHVLPFFSRPDCVASPCTSTCARLWPSRSGAGVAEDCGVAEARQGQSLRRFNKIALQSHLKWAEALRSLGMRVLMKQNHFPAMFSTFSHFIA